MAYQAVEMCVDVGEKKAHITMPCGPLVTVHVAADVAAGEAWEAEMDLNAHPEHQQKVHDVLPVLLVLPGSSRQF